MALTEEDKDWLKETTKKLNATRSLEKTVREANGKVSHRGQLSREEVDQKADKIFKEELLDLNNWDRRRVLNRIERRNRSY